MRAKLQLFLLLLLAGCTLLGTEPEPAESATFAKIIRSYSLIQDIVSEEAPSGLAELANGDILIYSREEIDFSKRIFTVVDRSGRLLRSIKLPISQIGLDYASLNKTPEGRPVLTGMGIYGGGYHIPGVFEFLSSGTPNFDPGQYALDSLMIGNECLFFTIFSVISPTLYYVLYQDCNTYSWHLEKYNNRYREFYYALPPWPETSDARIWSDANGVTILSTDYFSLSNPLRVMRLNSSGVLLLDKFLPDYSPERFNEDYQWLYQSKSDGTARILLDNPYELITLTNDLEVVNSTTFPCNFNCEMHVEPNYTNLDLTLLYQGLRGGGNAYKFWEVQDSNISGAFQLSWPGLSNFRGRYLIQLSDGSYAILSTAEDGHYGYYILHILDKDFKIR